MRREEATTSPEQDHPPRWPFAARPFAGALALNALAIGVFLAAPAGSAWQVAAWCTPLVLITVAITVRTVRAAPTERRLMRLLLAALYVYVAAALAWYGIPVGLGRPLPSPSPADALFFVSYTLFAVFLFAVLRRVLRTRSEGQHTALLDSLVFTGSATAVLWAVSIGPHLRSGTPPLITTVAVLYPAFLLLLFALATRLALAGGFPWSAPGTLLVVFVGAELGGDVVYSTQTAAGTFTYDSPVVLVYLVGATALACLTAHPDLQFLLQAGLGKEGYTWRHGDVGTRWGRPIRTALLLVAALVPLVLHMIRHHSSVLIVVSTVMVALIFWRASLLAGDLDEQQRLAGELGSAVERLRVQRDELARYATIVEAAEDAVLTVSLDGIITDWSGGAERMFGYGRTEAVGRSVELIFTTVEHDTLTAMLAETAQRGHVSLRDVAQHRDGTPVQVSVLTSVIRDDAGAATAIVGILRDITERLAKDAQLERESKLEALGRLSAGLAHEINTPIQFVGDNARFLAEAYGELIDVVGFYRGLMDTDNPISWSERQEQMRQAEAGIDFEYLQEEIPSAVAQTLEGIERVSTIVRAMKTFSHPGHQEQVHADLNEALSATVTVTRYQVKAVADLDLRLGDLPPVRCNIADLNQVFLNLIVNAADAIEETGRHGRITVSTSVEGTAAVVRISDTGGGIPDDALGKIFDPFFTTKEVGRGSGQGLPLARAVVQEGHGGTLRVATTPAKGTTFTVTLPIDGRRQPDDPGREPAFALVG